MTVESDDEIDVFEKVVRTARWMVRALGAVDVLRAMATGLTDFPYLATPCRLANVRTVLVIPVTTLRILVEKSMPALAVITIVVAVSSLW